MRSDWSTLCFCVSKQNGLLTFCGFFLCFPCQCCSKAMQLFFLRQLSEMLNFWTIFGPGKLTNHKFCEVQQVVMQMIKLKVCCKKQNSDLLWATYCRNLQHRNLLSNKSSARVVKRATTLFNLQLNNVARQVVRKCYPYYLTFGLRADGRTLLTNNSQHFFKFFYLQS